MKNNYNYTDRTVKLKFSCQYWEWYGNDDYTVGRYKPKGGMDFIVEAKETDYMYKEEELKAAFDEKYNVDGEYTKYEVQGIELYYPPTELGTLEVEDYDPDAETPEQASNRMIAEG